MKTLGAPAADVKKAVESGALRFAVYGLGKMGLPLAAILANCGARVTGVDVDASVVSCINAGDCPVSGEPGLADLVRRSVAGRRLAATVDGTQAARDADVMVILVPSLLTDDKRPDLSAIQSVCRTIASGLRPGDLVLLESTVPPRTTRDVVLPLLLESGLALGDFGLAFCPERTSSGRALKDIRGAYPKVVGGIDAPSTAAAMAIYEVVNAAGVTPVADATTAEAVKLFECIHRDVNIAFANEVALVCRELGVDVSEVMQRAGEPVNDATGRPFVSFLTPGPGVGGHCIPVYPYFVNRTVSTDTMVISAARRRNEGMPEYVVRRVVEALGEQGLAVEGSRVMVMGLAYRSGVKETRYSPALEIVRWLKEKGARVSAWDPNFTRAEVEEMGIAFSDGVDDADCCIVLTAELAFKEVDWTAALQRSGSCIIIVDCCGVVPEPAGERKVMRVFQ